MWLRFPTGSIAEQNQTDALRESEEFRDAEVEESGVVQGIMGDNIPLDSLDPTKDPNIALPEVCVGITKRSTGGVGFGE